MGPLILKALTFYYLLRTNSTKLRHHRAERRDSIASAGSLHTQVLMTHDGGILGSWWHQDAIFLSFSSTWESEHPEHVLIIWANVDNHDTTLKMFVVSFICPLRFRVFVSNCLFVNSFVTELSRPQDEKGCTGFSLPLDRAVWGKGRGKVRILRGGERLIISHIRDVSSRSMSSPEPCLYVCLSVQPILSSICSLGALALCWQCSHGDRCPMCPDSLECAEMRQNDERTHTQTVVFIMLDVGSVPRLTGVRCAWPVSDDAWPWSVLISHRLVTTIIITGPPPATWAPISLSPLSSTQHLAH